MAFLDYRPTGTLFQYCSSDAFLAILKSKRLWFSNLLSANDPREFKLGYRLFIEALKSVRHDEYRGEGGLFLSILAARLAELPHGVHVFSCSFSKADDELPMWGVYGSNYSGIAVGFRPTALLGIPARIQLVRYVDDKTPEDIRKLVLDIASGFDATHPASDLEFWVPATVSSSAFIFSLKHRSWAYEREVRMVHMQPINDPAESAPNFEIPTGYRKDGEPMRWSKPLERQGRTGIVKYLEFPFGRFRDGAFDPRQAISRVTVGPNCDLSVSDVIDVMHHNGFEKVEVRKSTCEIR
jgi:Protein of unknown function (DUF2971)